MRTIYNNENLIIDMRNILKLTLIILCFSQFSCKTNSNDNGQRELVPNPEKYEHDGYSQLPDSLKPDFYPDTVIGKISFLNTENVSDYLGVDVMDRLIDRGLLTTEVLSKDKKQILKIYFHPGSYKNEFSEFEIKYNDKTGKDLWIVDDTEFKTENDIKLGITIGDLRSIKGEPDSIINNSTFTLHYEINLNDTSDFLNKYNMPEYYSDYEFKNGYLIRFKFGFEYP
jgi:hypothetical protein